MNRVLLILILCLGGLLAGGRLTGAAESELIVSPVRRAPPAPLGPPSPLPAAAPGLLVAPPSPTPLLGQLARLEARRRLGFSVRFTYLDSMLVSADSVIRRWPVLGPPLRVIINLPDSAGERRLDEVVWTAFTVWERPDLGIRFIRASDSLEADIVVSWVDHFAEAVGVDGAHQSGLTGVLGDGKGELQLARVQLALGDGRGHLLTDQEIGLVALHEVGHALGLPHSSSPDDIMFPTVLTGQLSSRDHATLTLLYSLPPGPLREPSEP